MRSITLLCECDCLTDSAGVYFNVSQQLTETLSVMLTFKELNMFLLNPQRSPCVLMMMSLSAEHLDF